MGLGSLGRVGPEQTSLGRSRNKLFGTVKSQALGQLGSHWDFLGTFFPSDYKVHHSL